MYKIIVFSKVEGQKDLHLHTENRNLARSMVQLGEENDLTVKVRVEVEAKEVKFKGL